MHWIAGWRCALLLPSPCCTQHTFVSASPVAYVLAPQAVRLLHYNYASDVARRRRLASQHAEREGIAHPIGTCFVHRVRGCEWGCLAC